MSYILLLFVLLLYIFCFVWSAPLSLQQKIGLERCAWLLGSSFGLSCMSLLLCVVELLPGIARWCARLSCVAPFYISIYCSSWLLLALSSFHVFLVLLLEEQIMGFSRRYCYEWLLIANGFVSANLQRLSNRNLCVLAAGVFLFAEIWCMLEFRKVVILWFASTMMAVSWVKALGSPNPVFGRGSLALLLCTFGSLLLLFCFWTALLIFDGLWIEADATPFLVTSLISASVCLERWRLRQKEKRKAKGARNLAQIIGLN